MKLSIDDFFNRIFVSSNKYEYIDKTDITLFMPQFLFLMGGFFIGAFKCLTTPNSYLTMLTSRTGNHRKLTNEIKGITIIKLSLYVILYFALMYFLVKMFTPDMLHTYKFESKIKVITMILSRIAFLESITVLGLSIYIRKDYLETILGVIFLIVIILATDFQMKTLNLLLYDSVLNIETFLLSLIIYVIAQVSISKAKKIKLD
ncbi:MAG: hypothetical protein LBS33_03905 [Streptococcaceae bacterium]|jgi:hypothetical protein|nr:hypothetical protein [Streptococcaceae bacterium]